MDELTVVYENEDIIIKKAKHGIYAGYKGCPMYRAWGVVENYFIDNMPWTLNFKRCGNVITNFHFERGVSGGFYLDNNWYKHIGDGRYEYNGRTLYPASLVKINFDGSKSMYGLMGYVDESEVES